MMTEHEFRAKWQREAPLYDAWGRLVLASSLADIRQKLGGIVFSNFLKIPVIPRLKDTKKLIEKAFTRKKDYTNPYSDITDKIGVRFVLQTTEDVQSVCRIIEECQAWTCSKDKDFLAEQKSKPEQFAYQSMHYVVQNRDEIRHDDLIIPEGTPCEIQVRTLLQHALAELTHDITYKPKTAAASPEVQRLCARAVALIEVADDIFVKVAESVKTAFEPLEPVMDSLSLLYIRYVEYAPEQGALNSYLVDAYHEELARMDTPSELTAFYSQPGNAFIFQKIQARRELSALYRQAAILLIYYLVKTHPNATCRDWPLPSDEIKPIFSDLGQRMPNA